MLEDIINQIETGTTSRTLKGGELADVSPTAELSALAKLMANWRSLIEDAAMTSAERDERKTGQKPLDFVKESRR